MIDDIEARVLSGAPLTEAEFDSLRALQERIADTLDIAEGQRLGIDPGDFRPRSRSNGFAIVVGHTAADEGAVGIAPVSSQEYSWNRDLAQRMLSHCAAQGTTAKVFYRDQIGIAGAYQQVKAWGAACVVELHFNSFNGAAHGTETLYDGDTNAGSKAWAQLLQDAMLDTLGLKDRGLKERDPGDRGYKSLSQLDIPTALIEPFFGDNPDNAEVAQARKGALAAKLAGAAKLHLTGA